MRICGITRSLLLLVAGLNVLSRGAQAEGLIRVGTVVTPLDGEDIAAGCHYELALPSGHDPVRGAWVIFDRGRDVHDLYGDPDVLAFARRYHLGLLLHGNCPGKLTSDHDDMNMDPSQGLGPALMRALEQFAVITGHAELAKANLILLGFSGAGVLTARLIGAYPQRVIAAVLSAPGHFRPNGIDSVELNDEARAVPELIIAGGADAVSGTQLPYQYFGRHRQHGAPWTFVLQNRSPHCCTANAKLLMLHWLEGAIRQRVPARNHNPLQPIRQRYSWAGGMTLQKTELHDSFGLLTFNASDVEIQPMSLAALVRESQASWLPTRAVAREWLSFMQQSAASVQPTNSPRASLSSR